MEITEITKTELISLLGAGLYNELVRRNLLHKILQEKKLRLRETFSNPTEQVIESLRLGYSVYDCTHRHNASLNFVRKIERELKQTEKMPWRIINAAICDKLLSSILNFERLTNEYSSEAEGVYKCTYWINRGERDVVRLKQIRSAHMKKLKKLEKLILSVIDSFTTPIKECDDLISKYPGCTNYRDYRSEIADIMAQFDKAGIKAGIKTIPLGEYRPQEELRILIE